MSAHRSVQKFHTLLLTLCGWLLGSMAIAADPGLAPTRGEELFKRRWQAHDSESPKGDGLGPMFNDRSCVACHHLSGAGGAGGNDHNVEVLSVDFSASMLLDGSVSREWLANALPGIHRGLLSDPATTVLHRSSTDGRYREWRDKLAPPLRLGTVPPVRILTPKYGVVLQLSQRSTPALFGAAEIDAVSADTLRKLARWQLRYSPRNAGRVSTGSSEVVGRFGWRGQTATLEDFVRGACAAEVGLQLEVNRQPLNPLERVPKNRLRSSFADDSRDSNVIGCGCCARPQRVKNTEVDMSEHDVGQLVNFVASLPSARQQLPRDPRVLSAVRRGEHVFKTIGCAFCHPRKLGDIDGVFSDLLLHDMGEGLADLRVGEISRSEFSSGYGGGSSPSMILVFQPNSQRQREWRTPPLWGVRDSAPYLHDGRAATLREAIELHGGQGKEAAEKFAALDDSQDAQLMLFLDTLVAPGGEF